MCVALGHFQNSRGIKMKTMTLKTKMMNLALCCLSMASASVASADGYWTTCTTMSNGYQYRDADYGMEQARNRTVRACTSNYNTNPGECRFNSRCDGEYPGVYARCSTQSAGLTFKDGDINVRAAQDRVIRACTSNYSARPGDCRYNLRCDGGYADPGYPQPQPPYYPPQPQPQPPYYPPQPQPPYEDPNRQFVCTTRSNGREFSVPGRGYQATRAKVVAICQQSGYTNHYECDRNARCQ